MKAHGLYRRWLQETQGIAAVEAALIFPVLMIMMVGVFDLGYGILAAQKTIRASQITADLVTRLSIIKENEIQEAVQSGRLAMVPYDETSYGVDIISIAFDDDAEPQIVWRETVNISPAPSVLSDVAALSEPNSGVVMVLSQYSYKPTFTGFLFDQMELKERAFAKSRSGNVVRKENER